MDISLPRYFISLLFAGIFLSTSVVRGQGLSEEKISPIMLEGIEASYNLEFERADSLFLLAQSISPDNPRPVMFRSMMWLWQFMFNKDKPSFSRFVSLSDSAISLSRTSAKTYPDNPTPKIVEATMYAFRSVANVRAENFVKASWDSRLAYNSIRQVVKEYPEAYDAYLPMGLFDFVIGIMPKAIRTLVNLSGVEGDKDRGLKMLNIAAERSLYAKNDAKLILALLSVYYKNDYNAGVPILKAMSKQYPNNVPILFALGNIESQLKKIALAVPYYERVLKLSDGKFVAFTAYSQYRLGESFYRLGDYQKSKEAFQKFILLNFEKSFRAHAMYRLATVYEILGDREQAVKGYRRTMQVLPVTAEDRYALRKAKKAIGTPLSNDEKNLIEFSNAVESLRFEQAEKYRKTLLNVKGDILAEMSYQYGEMLRLQEKFPQAEEQFKKVITRRPIDEKWLLPWSYFRLSQVYEATGKTKSARAMADQARAFFDYDFEEWLQFQLERDITALNRVN